jgi:peroxiredoxin
MKKLHIATWTVIAFAVAALAEPKIGQPAPDFTAKDINGKAHRLSDYRGKVVVLEAYNLDCPFCANHYKSGAMQALQAAVTSKGGIWLVVNSSHTSTPSHRSAEAARTEFTAQGMKATAWLDDSSGTVGKLFGMKTTPHMFVIDPQGVLVYQGAIDDRAASSGDPRSARNYVKQAVEAVIAGKPVPVSETKPYGCGVKYSP